MYRKRNIYFPGDISVRFSSSGFSSVDHIWALVAFTKFSSNSVSNSPGYSNSKFALRYGPLRGTKFFLQVPGLFSLSGLGPGYYCLCTYTFHHHCPFKGYGKFLKNYCLLLRSGNWVAQWPIAHNQILRYDSSYKQILRYGP